MSYLRPVGKDLAWANRRLLSDRLGWPIGALQECEWLERDHPGWFPTWRPANEWAKEEDGYYATRYDADHRDPVQYGATPGDLAKAIEAAPPPWTEINYKKRPLLG